MKKIFGWTWRIAIVLLFIYGYKTINTWYFVKPKLDVQEQVIAIEEGSSFRDIAFDLEKQDIISAPKSFMLYGILHRVTSRVHAGTFSLTPGSSYKTIVNHLRIAKMGDIEVTIPEGYTNEQIGVVLEEKLEIKQEDWIRITKDMEGYLFPDTYRFLPTQNAEEIVNIMKDNFDARIKKAELNPSKEQVIIASILEKEVRDPKEMAHVSDIIRKRLEMGMALQMDSTVNYITKSGRVSATREDLETDSLYNTYKYPGLPPGPISNPGINAIRSAMYPSNNTYYYFLTDKNGKVYYADTFDQHIANRKYLQ